MTRTSILTRSTSPRFEPTSRTSESISVAARSSSTELPTLPRRDPVEFGQLLLRRRPVHGADVLLDLLRRGGPGDDARHNGIAQQPAEREFEHGAAATGGKCFERADDAPVALADELLRMTLVLRQPRARRHWRAAPVLAGEEAAGERKVRQDAQSTRLCQRKKLALDVAHQQAVLVLT